MITVESYVKTSAKEQAPNDGLTHLFRAVSIVSGVRLCCDLFGHARLHPKDSEPLIPLRNSLPVHQFI